MDIKMIVSDLDRTLLCSDKSISAVTAQVLNRCREMGMIVAFATARPKRTVIHFLEAIPADAVILHNGALVLVGEELLFHCGIAPEIAKNILLSITRDYPQATLSAELNDIFYANFDVSTVWNQAEAIRTDFTDLPGVLAEKIIVGVNSMDDILAMSTYLPDDLYIEMSDGKLGLIMHKQATKLQAVQLLAEHYGVPLEAVAAFGDDYNDLEMLRGVGVGVAMGNALEEVKAAADFVCGTNDEDGMANWIIKTIFKE